MRLILAFLAVAAASRSYLDQETGYRPGKDYQYFYTSQVLSGVSVDNIQYAGIKFYGNVRFSTNSDSSGKLVHGRFEPMRIFRMNREIGHYHPTDPIPDSEWLPVEGPEQQTINHFLQKPFSFEIVPGKYINFKTESDDPAWSANVKRGMLSFMQLDLGNAQSERDPEELRLMDKLNLVTPQREDHQRTVYRTQEEDITGICESVYSRQPAQSYGSDAPVYRITKVRNYDKCQFRPKWERGLMDNIVYNPANYDEKKVLRWQVDSDLEVQGDRNSYIIKHGRLISRQHFNRMDIKKGKLITYSLQQIKLVSVEDSRERSRDMPNLEKKSLIMEMPEPSFTERQQRQESTSEERAKLDLMDELLNEAESMTHPNVLPNATKPFAKINILLKKMAPQSVRSLIQKYCLSSQQLTQKGQILVDSLTTCTRPDTVPLISELVKRNIITDMRGGYMVGMIAQLADATPGLSSQLLNVIKDNTKLPDNKIQTRRSALLAFGTVGFKLAEKAKKLREPSLERVVDAVADELVQLLASAKTTHEKIVVLKAIGNSGLKNCFNACKATIENHSEPLTVRVKAMYALRRITLRTRQHEAQSLAVSVYMNPARPEDLRIAGFIVAMESNPSSGLLKMMCRALAREPSLQVGSFVYSYLENRKDWQNPVYRNQTLAIKEALVYAKPFRPGFTYSKDFKWEHYFEEAKSSFMPEIAYVMSRNSILPETLVGRVDVDLIGMPWLGTEIGIDMEGLQTIMKNVAGPQSALKDLLQGRLSLKDILEPIQHASPEMLSHIRTMMDKITISERELQNFAATMYVKHLDFETQYFTLDSRSMESVLQYTLGNSGQLMRELEQGWQMKTVRSIPVIDQSYCVPTPTGLPLYMNLTWNPVFVLESSAQVENMPSVRDLVSAILPSRSSYFGRRDSDYQRDRNWRRSSAQEVKFDLHLKPTLALDIDVTVGVELDNLRTAVDQHMKIFAQYPLSTEIKIDLDTGKVKTKLRLPQRSEKILQFVENTKTCFIRDPESPESPRFYVEEKIVAFPRCTRIINSRDRYRVPYANVDLEVYSEKAFFTRPTPLFKWLYGLQNYTVFMQPTSDMAREISVKTVYLGPERADRATDLIHEVLDIDRDSDSDSDSEDRDDRQRRSSDDDDSDSWWWSWGGSQRSSYGQSRSSSRYPFEPVRAKSSVSSSNKYKIVSCIKAHGSRAEKKIKLQLTHMCSDDMKKHQDDIQIVYDPVYESSSQEKKIVLSTFTDTDVIKKYLIDGHSPYADSKELVCKAELFYGPKDYTEKYIDAELKMGRGAPLSLSRVHTTRTYQEPTRAAPIEVSVDVDYQKMPRPVVYYSKKIDLLLKLLPYITDQVSVETEEARNPPNKLKVVAEFRSDESEIELLVKKPTEDAVIKGIPIPFLPRRDAVCSVSEGGCYNKYSGRDYDFYRSSGPRPMDSFIHYISGGRVPGKCQILGQQIHTFDKESVHFPKTDCEIILAKDCSSSRSPKFMITLKEKNKEENKKIIHIYDPQHKIKVEPKDGWFESGIQVEVDDRKVSVPEDGRRITVHKRESDPTSEKVCDIKKKYGKIEIYSYKSQITVKTDGVDVDVDAHPSYYGQLCGACSNYNSEPMDDLMGPRKEMYSRPEEFLLSYIIPSSRCNIDEVRAKLASRIPRLFASRDSKSCQKISEYRYETQQRDGETQACFSVRPVPTCAGDCAQSKERSTPVGFFCMRATDSKVPALLNKIKEGKELTEVKGKKPHFTKDVKAAEDCRSRSANDARRQEGRSKDDEDRQYIQEA